MGWTVKQQFGGGNRSALKNPLARRGAQESTQKRDLPNFTFPLT
jgi:hypothetical protein